jgi:hypothetical protein
MHKLYYPGFIPEQRRHGKHGLLMTLCIEYLIGGVIIVVASPFKMGKKSCMMFPEMFNGSSAILGCVT